MKDSDLVISPTSLGYPTDARIISNMIAVHLPTIILYIYEVDSMKYNPSKLAETAHFVLFITHSRIIFSGNTYAQYNIIYFEKYLFFEN